MRLRALALIGVIAVLALLAGRPAHADRPSAAPPGWTIAVDGTRASGELQGASVPSHAMLILESTTGLRSGNAILDYILQVIGLYDGHTQWARVTEASGIQTLPCIGFACRPGTGAFVPAGNEALWRLEGLPGANGTAELVVEPTLASVAYDGVLFVAGLVMDRLFTGCLLGLSKSLVASIVVDVALALVWGAGDLANAIWRADIAAFMDEVWRISGLVLDTIVVELPRLSVDAFAQACLDDLARTFWKKAAFMVGVALDAGRAVGLLGAWAATLVSSDRDTAMKISYAGSTLPCRTSPTDPRCITPTCSISPLSSTCGPTPCPISPLRAGCPPPSCRTSPPLCFTPTRTPTPVNPCVQSPPLCVTPPNPCLVSPPLCWTPTPHPCVVSPPWCVTPPNPCPVSPPGSCFTPTRTPTPFNPCFGSPPQPCVTRASPP